MHDKSDDKITSLRLQLSKVGFSPIPTRGKIPIVESWQRFGDAGDAEIISWLSEFPTAINTGIIARRTPAIDIDLLNADAVAAAVQLIRQRFNGSARILLRTGLAPKVLIPFRTSKPIKKISAIFKPSIEGGKDEKLEFLGDGQQFITHGIHPDTKEPYTWHGGELGEVTWEELPEITQADAKSLFEDIARLVAGFGYERKGGKKSDDSNPFEDVQRERKERSDGPADVEKVKAALKLIPSDDEKIWFEIGAALHFEFGKDGFPIFDKWSATSAKYKPRDIKQKWKHYIDYKISNFTVATIYHYVNQISPDWSKQYDSEHKPVIRITAGDEEANALKAQHLLIAAGSKIYQYSGALVLPIVEEVDASDERKTTVVRIRRITHPVLNLELCRHVQFEKFEGRSKKWKRIRADGNTTTDILAQEGRWLFPRIVGVITTPTLRPDGTILSTPGYDGQTGLLLLAPPPMPAIPEYPTREDAEAALALLKAPLVEFPFIDGVSRAVGLSAIITPIVRGAFPVTPAHCARSPVSGSGKSYFMDYVASVATGKLMPVMSAVITNEEETAKRLTAALCSGQSLISIDNVNGELGGDTLCQAIERPIITVRPFGKNTEQIEVVARGTSIFMTGNNITLVGDLNRRVITTTLDPRLEQPELREFKGNPVQTVLENRGKYIAACLTICRAYTVAGRPNKARPLASFEGWSDTVRSALMWLGEADPVTSIQNTRVEDPQRIHLQTMLTAWKDFIGVGDDKGLPLAEAVRKAYTAIATHENNHGFGASGQKSEMDKEVDKAEADKAEVLIGAITNVATKRGELGGIDHDRLGKWFRKNKGKIVNGQRFTNKPGSGGVAHWHVEADLK
jgi:putative DNA primase/helicase